MAYEDLTPDEQATLELLRENAPEAPTALASLDEASRARVLEALSRSPRRSRARSSGPLTSSG